MDAIFTFNEPDAESLPAGPVTVPAASTAEETAGRLAALLLHPPHHAVLTGIAIGDRAGAEAVMRALAGHEGRLSFTRVRVDPDEAARQGSVTRYSRTHLPLTLHTDCAYSARPHDFVAFQMVHADRAGGGRSFVVPVAEIMAALSAEEKAALRRPDFMFGPDGALPILWGPEGAESMRYYRAQIDAALAARGAPADPLLDRIDALLDRLAAGRAFTLADGDILFIDNHRALHGRTGFPARSARLMFRHRARR